MSIQVKVLQKRNPSDPKQPKKFYAQIIPAKEVTLRKLVDAIADRCTLTGSDIKAVLDSLMVTLKKELADGNIVRLGDLGSFRASVSSKGEDTEKKCTANSVKKARVIFVPSIELKEAVAGFSFSKLGEKKEEGKKEDGKTDDGTGEAPDPIG